jgi:uncharacterized protein (TIRG00374 family)
VKWRLVTPRLFLRLALLALSLALLWLTLRNAPLVEIWAQLRQLSAGRIVLLALINVLVILSFSGRWWLLLWAQGYRLPYLRLTTYRLAAFAISYVTPGPHFGGEPLQVYLVKQRHDVPLAAVVASVLLDKTLEMVINFAFLLVGVAFVLQRQALRGQAHFFGYGLLLLALPVGLLSAIAAGWHPVSWLLARATQLWRRLIWPGRSDDRSLAQRLRAEQVYRTICEGENQSTKLFRHQPWLIGAAVGVSLLSWLGMMGEFWFMTQTLRLGLDFSEAMVALLAARAAILLPLPAGLGALEASQMLAMRSLGQAAAAGISLSLLIRGRDIVTAVLGLWIASTAVARQREQSAEPSLPWQ